MIGMQHLSQRFSHVLRWNAIEAVLYQVILFGHQLILFKSIPLSLYGLAGTFFSLIYMSIVIVNFGFDLTLTTFFTWYIQNKGTKKTLLQHLALQSFVLMSLIPLWYYLGSFLLFSSIPKFVYGVAGIIAMLEGVKRNIKTTLQLLFLSKYVAILEIATVCLYVTWVWLIFFATGTLTIMNILLPMAVTSFTDACVLWMIVYWHSTTSATSGASGEIQKPSTGRLARNRFYNWLSQLSSLLFSSNFLTPFFSLIFGLSHAGLFKLMSSITYFITTITHKLLGTTSATLLTHVKQMPLEEKQSLFALITKQCNGILYGIIVFACINYQAILTLNGISNAASHHLALLFLLLNLIDQFFIVYEKFMLAEEKTASILAINIINIIFLGPLIALSSSLSSVVILGLFAIVRSTLLVSISFIFTRRWHMHTHWYIDRGSLISFAAMALATRAVLYCL